MRNLTFNNAVTAISHFWNWGWTYQGININNCQLGIDISTGSSDQQSVGSITLFDSSFTNTPVAIKSARTDSSAPHTAGSIILENVALDNVGTVVQGPNGTILAGSSGSSVIAAWGQGNQYTPSGPSEFVSDIMPATRPAGLLDGSKFYQRSKPQYESLPASSFVSARDGGAKGDGTTDDTAALQSVMDNAAGSGKVVYIDAGVYKVTGTLKVPANSKIVGEGYPVIMSSGDFFNNIDEPKPVVQVGQAGEQGQVELSDLILSTQGPQAGAILIEWNIASPSAPGGLWDVHARVGGFAGSQQTTKECAKSTNSADVNKNCIAAYMLMHVTSSASDLYMENCWLWVSDQYVSLYSPFAETSLFYSHANNSNSDVDVQTEADGGQITIYSGRGLNIESTAGNIWL
jgi:glucan 1,3-beta-glucosidase